MAEPTREALEAHTGLKLDDWQWHCIKAINGASGYGTFDSGRWTGKRLAMERLMECYEALGYRVDKVDYGYLIYEPGEPS